MANVSGDKGWCVWPASELARRLDAEAVENVTGPEDPTDFYTVDENGFHRKLMADEVQQVLQWLAMSADELRKSMLSKAKDY